VSKLLLMELYEVEDGGAEGATLDRYDHISSKGKVKRRLQVLER
jgi:hypothetical protein